MRQFPLMSQLKLPKSGDLKETMTDKTVEKSIVTLAGTVEKIIESPHPSDAEKSRDRP
jgi:hypothetical protein